MSSEYRSGQGSIIPTMIIGLGGTGSRVVDRIASRAVHLPNWESQLRPLTTFVSIDTNELDQHKLRNLPESNRLNIGAFDKAKAVDGFRRSKDPQALQWLDRRYQPRPGFKPGAGQSRVESRLGFFFHSPDIRQRLKELVNDSLRPGITWRQVSPPKYNVYLFCTLAGGTGSGSLLSTAYLIESVIREQNWHPRVFGYLMLSTLLLDKVGPELHPDIHANTYAALKEVEHLTKLDYAQVRREGRTSEPFVYFRDENRHEVSHVTSRPFFISFIFDRPPHLGLADADRVIADSAYLQIFTPIMDNLVGELDNYEKKLEELSRFPGDLKNVRLGYTKNFGAFGAAAMVLPGEDLLEYCSLRFASQAIRSHITFGVSSIRANDDRDRALSKLAIDYSEPEFLKKSEEERDRTVNEAFAASVQELARQDSDQDLFDGYWYQLVESVDEGFTTGSDVEGNPIREESKIDLVNRKLTEMRGDLFTKVSIKERAFSFRREGVPQYVQLVARLMEDIHQVRLIVNEGASGLETAVQGGKAISGLKLDPIAERYLVVQALEQCEKEWIPKAYKDFEEARTKDVRNPKVKERLERELYEALQEAAGRPGLLNRGDKAFLDVRQEAQDYYRSVADAAKETFYAEVRLRQLRALLDYLKRRLRQFTQLATRMDFLVQDLERNAERLRRGETFVVPPLALRVEVFETLDEPRRRIWDLVYQRLFLDGGRFISTFHRGSIAKTITDALKPVIHPDGTVAEKGLDTTVADLRWALTRLGKTRLKPAILGDADAKGLDLVQGLEIEARLLLEPTKKPGEDVTFQEIDEYRERKFRALAQISGVLARVSYADFKPLDDGVTLNRTRQLLLGESETSSWKASSAFHDQLTSVLQASGRQVKTDRWHDTRLIVVHDVEIPLPLYYIEPITGEIENFYLHMASAERLPYDLHIDFNWEKSLPNLNPQRPEITEGWSFKVLAKGLLTGTIRYEGGSWVWLVEEGSVQRLGETLSIALYRLGEIHSRFKDLRRDLEEQIDSSMKESSSKEEKTRRNKLTENLHSALAKMELRVFGNAMSSQEMLDIPIIRTIMNQLRDEESDDIEPEARYKSFHV